MNSTDPTQTRRTTILSFADTGETPEIQSLIQKDIPLTLQERLLQIGITILGVAACGTSIYFVTQEAKNVEENRRAFSISVWSVGASGAIVYHTLCPPRLRKQINKVMSAWVYEAFYIATQVYLNIDSIEIRNKFHGAFVGTAGFFQIRDVASLISLRRSDYAQTLTYPPDEKDLIPMFPPNTRNTTLNRINFSRLFLAAAVTAIFFALRYRYPEDPLNKRRFYEDMTAAYTGSIVGEVATTLLDDLKEHYEMKNQQSDLPLGLKCARTIKTVFFLSAPIVIGASLQALPPSNAPPNNPSSSNANNYMIMLFIGAIHGSLYFLLKRERENPLSSYHTIRKISNETQVNEPLTTSKEKVISAVKKYFFSLFALAGLHAYMIYAGVGSDKRIITAIVAFLIFSNLSFIATDTLVQNYVPKTSREIKALIKNKGLEPKSLWGRIFALWQRFLNEVHFRLTTPALLAVFYQYLTTKFNISSENIQTVPYEVFVPIVLAYCLFGITWWNQRALYIQEKQKERYTSPVAAIEMIKSVAYGLR